MPVDLLGFWQILINPVVSGNMSREPWKIGFNTGQYEDMLKLTFFSTLTLLISLFSLLSRLDIF